MVRKIGLCILVCLALFSCEFKKTASHKEFSRIISLSPHITEIIFALGQEDKLAGITDFCTYPPETAEKEKIGGLLNPNFERIVSLSPDILIGTPAVHDLAVRLKSQNLNFVLLENDRLEDLFAAVDSIGILLNCEDRSDSLNKMIKDSLHYYSGLSKELSEAKPAALMVIGRDIGSTRNITAAGPGTFIDTVWNYCGGENLFSDLPAFYSRVSREAVLDRQPDLIIEFKFKETWNSRKNQANIVQWQEFENLKAAAAGNIFVITGDYSLIPGPRLYLLARDFYRIFDTYIKNQH